MINLEYEEVLEQSRWYEKRPETSIPGRVFNFRVSMRIKVVRCQYSQAAGISRKYPFLTIESSRWDLEKVSVFNNTVKPLGSRESIRF
jgi:hypothetical protein